MGVVDDGILVVVGSGWMQGLVRDIQLSTVGGSEHLCRMVAVRSRVET